MKFLNLLFVLAFVFSMASCGGAAESTEAPKTEEAPKEEAPKEEVKAEEAPAADTTKKAEEKAH
jgi:hypothetical protein